MFKGLLKLITWTPPHPKCYIKDLAAGLCIVAEWEYTGLLKWVQRTKSSYCPTVLPAGKGPIAEDVRQRIKEHQEKCKVELCGIATGHWKLLKSTHNWFWWFLLAFFSNSDVWSLENLILEAWFLLRGIGEKTASTLPVGQWKQAIQKKITKKRLKNRSLDEISTKLSIIDLFHSLRISS